MLVTQLGALRSLRVGLGFGALEPLRRLGMAVNRVLPLCVYEPLTDADATDGDDGCWSGSCAAVDTATNMGASSSSSSSSSNSSSILNGNGYLDSHEQEWH